jgi:hypothetical protein
MEFDGMESRRVELELLLFGLPGELSEQSLSQHRDVTTAIADGYRAGFPHVRLATCFVNRA